MRICAIMKYPPIQGGVSAQCFWWARGLADAGHQVFVVTNAEEVEDNYRIQLTAQDREWLEYDSPQGGSVRLFNPEPFSVKFTHIPQSNPFVSKLASIATDVIRRYDCQIIFTYYLEPYGMAAFLASTWTGTPFLCHHAGSDLGRLMNQPDLGTAYREVIRRADGLCCRSAYSFLGLGANADSIYPDPSFYLPRRYFNPQVEPLDLNVHIGEMAGQYPELTPNSSPLDSSLPTIGIYGKMGALKGSYDLLTALGRLKRDGLRFNFVAMTRGREMEKYLQAVSDSGLGETAWVLPFIPHWKVGRFIRACDAVCFLERDFPIKFHAPTIPSEIFSCGTCVVLSGEVARKQSFHDRMKDGGNYLQVPDPKDHAALQSVLRQVIEQPEKCARVGLKGAELVDQSKEHSSIVEQYEAILKDICRRHRGEPGTLSPQERGLPASRGNALWNLSPTVKVALGEEAESLLQSYLDQYPEPSPNPIEDARSWLGFLRSRLQDGSDELSDAIRFSELALWQLSIDDEEGVKEGMFDRTSDLVLDSSNTLTPEVWARYAPLRSKWIRWESFRSLPGGRVAKEGGVSADPGEKVIVFHRRPSLNSRHFQITPATAMLLERCDGSRSVEEIIREFQQQSGRQDVAREILGMLRQFFREGMVILVHPRPQEASQPEFASQT